MRGIMSIIVFKVSDASLENTRASIMQNVATNKTNALGSFQFCFQFMQLSVFFCGPFPSLIHGFVS